MSSSLSPSSSCDSAPSPGKVVKKKGGRKPLYHTAEERRDRNREAQAAFRARKKRQMTTLSHGFDQLEALVLEYQRDNMRANDAVARLQARCSALEQVLKELSGQPDVDMLLEERLSENSSCSPRQAESEVDVCSEDGTYSGKCPPLVQELRRPSSSPQIGRRQASWKRQSSYRRLSRRRIRQRRSSSLRLRMPICSTPRPQTGFTVLHPALK